MATSPHDDPVPLDRCIESAWASLSAAPTEQPASFDTATLADLPSPAARLLGRSVPSGTPLSSTVRLTMRGEIKLGPRWFPYESEQILRAGEGFVWKPVVGGRLLRFTGADVLAEDDERMEFRLYGRIPVVRVSGADLRRSAEGRLAAETVAWLPQALTPQAGARWAPIDDARATVTLHAGGTDIDIEVAVDEDGRVRRVSLDRLRVIGESARVAPFGGPIDDEFVTSNGLHIAGRGSVGWDLGTPDEPDGVFFRYEVTSVDFGPRLDRPAA